MEIKIHNHLCKECGLCAEACPKKIIGYSDEINTAGYHYAMITDIEKCIKCGFCALMCPDVAIELVGEVEKNG